MDIYCNESMPSSPELERKKIKYSHELYNNNNDKNVKTKEYTNPSELLCYLQLLETHPVIREFLNYDCCYRLADKYLIAMVFIYFKRAGLQISDYTCLNFFAALCIAHSMEEEDEELCAEIYPWALGTKHLKELVPQLLDIKMHIWQAMDHRAVVSHHACQQVISIFPFHSIWKRQRTTVHGGAPREYIRNIPPPSDYDARYDQLTNTCAKCRKVQQTLFNYK